MDTCAIPISLVAVLGNSRLSKEAFEELQEGDVLLLDQSVKAPLCVRIGKKAFLKGYPGLKGARRALQIEDFHA